MAGRKEYRILEPQVGMVIQEHDPRVNLPKRIVELDDTYAYCRAGRDGRGNRSRVLRRRLAEGRYRLLSTGPDAKGRNR